MSGKLTIKQKKFADEYIISGNATESYKKAGYAWKSENTAYTNASRLLRNAKVKKYIEERMQDLEDEKIADQKEVLEYLTRVIRGEETEKVLVQVGRGKQAFAENIPSIADRTKAAELIGKRYGTFTDKVDLTSDLTIVFEDDYGD